jgi:hypothetical protein
MILNPSCQFSASASPSPLIQNDPQAIHAGPQQLIFHLLPRPFFHYYMFHTNGSFETS